MTLLEDGPDVSPGPTGMLPSAPKPPQAPRRRRPWKPRARKLATIVVVIIAVVWIHDRLVAPTVYQQRQQHLVGAFKALTPKIALDDAGVVLQIEKAEINTIVVEGATIDNLRGGPVRVTESALPGDPGVMVVLGHRRAYGGPFGSLTKLTEGDSIVAQARNGPIVDYRVQRVERATSLDTLELEDSDTLSYLVLVTSEAGWLNSEQLLVVARALPVSDVDPVVPDLTDGVERAGPFGVEALLVNAALAAAVLSWVFLRRRCSRPMAIAVVSPMAAFAVVRGLVLLDTVLPFTR